MVIVYKIHINYIVLSTIYQQFVDNILNSFCGKGNVVNLFTLNLLHVVFEKLLDG